MMGEPLLTSDLVSKSQALALRARLTTAAGAVLEGIPVEISRLTVILALPGDPSVPLPGVTEKVHLHFAGEPLEVPVDIEARTAFRNTAGGFMRLRFQSARTIPQTLHNALNRRGALRVSVEEEVSVEVRLPDREGEPPVEATLIDVSTKGLSIVFGRGEEEVLPASDTLHLSFVLPGDDEPIELGGTVRNRTDVEGSPRFGIEICVRTTDDHENVRDRLAEFVAGRMSELLRRWNVLEDS